MLIEETEEACTDPGDDAVNDIVNENLTGNGVLKMLKPGVIMILDSTMDEMGRNVSNQQDLIVRPIEMKEHSDDEWYPPTPPLYDVTDKLR